MVAHNTNQRRAHVMCGLTGMPFPEGKNREKISNWGRGNKKIYYLILVCG